MSNDSNLDLKQATTANSVIAIKGDELIGNQAVMDCCFIAVKKRLQSFELSAALPLPYNYPSRHHAPRVSLSPTSS